MSAPGMRKVEKLIDEFGDASDDEIFTSRNALLDAVRAIAAERDEWSKLRDPATLHANLLRGEPARLTREMLLHLLGDAAPQPVGEAADAAMHAALRSSVTLVAKGVPVGEVPMPEADEEDPIERLRYFCAMTMSGQDWMDSEKFFTALIEHVSAREAAGYAAGLAHGRLVREFNDALFDAALRGEVKP